MTTRNLRYDHPAYLTPQVFSGNTAVGANGVSPKFAAFTAMTIRECVMAPIIASTAAGSQPLMYTLNGTTTTTTTLTVLTSASRAVISNALTTPIALAKGDQVYVTHGTDATAQTCIAISCQVTGGADLTLA